MMEEIVYDRLSLDGMRQVKLVSDHAVSEARMRMFVGSGPTPSPSPNTSYLERGVSVHCYDTAALSLFYGEVTFPVRGAVEVMAEGWIKPRRFAVWRLMQADGLRVSEVIERLADWYFAQTHRKAGYVFMRKLPVGVEDGTPFGLRPLPPNSESANLGEDNELYIFEAEWALEKCVMVGG